MNIKVDKAKVNGDKTSYSFIISGYGNQKEALKELAKALKPYLDSIPNCECGKK